MYFFLNPVKVRRCTFTLSFKMGLEEKDQIRVLRKFAEGSRREWRSHGSVPMTSLESVSFIKGERA